MTDFFGKYPVFTKSSSMFSVTMEGTQLQEVVVLGAIVEVVALDAIMKKRA